MYISCTAGIIVWCPPMYLSTNLWPFSKSKFNIKSDRVNLVEPASPIECLLHLPNDRAIQYKLGPEKLTRLGNSNVLRLPVLPYFMYLMYNIVYYVSPYVQYCVSHVQYRILCFPLRKILCILCTVSNINVFPPMYRSYMCSIYLNFVPTWYLLCKILNNLCYFDF